MNPLNARSSSNAAFRKILSGGHPQTFIIGPDEWIWLHRH
jgi:hypothetical protein